MAGNWEWKINCRLIDFDNKRTSNNKNKEIKWIKMEYQTNFN